MRSPRALRFLCALLAGLLIALSVPVHADDTEVYLGPRALREGVHPNILFILDTSGSMYSYDGTPLTRLARLQAAMDQILGSLDNVNVGLMDFSDPGGPVLYPVAYIDDPASKYSAPSQPLMSLRIANSADDAEELVATDQMLLDSQLLELPHTPAFGGEVSLPPIPIDISSDDAYDLLDRATGAPRPGSLNTTSPVLYYTTQFVGSTLVSTVNGLRFNNVRIPSGARILASDIALESLSDDSSLITMIFQGEKTLSPATFSGASPPSARTSPADLTTAGAIWAPGTLLQGDYHTSVDLSDVIQEIIGLPGWTSGDSLSFIVRQGPSDPVGTREFSSYDFSNSTANAPRLEVTYATGPAGQQIVGLHFRDVRLPQGVHITSAVLQFVPLADDTSPDEVIIQGDLSPDSAPFSTTRGDLSQRLGHATSPVDWNVPAWTTTAGPQQSPNLAPILQQIVDQPNWCGGNDISLLIRQAPGAPTGQRRAFSYDRDPARAPVLLISYDTTTPLPAGGGCTVEDLQRQVQFDTDDATENGSGTVAVAGASLTLNDSNTVGLLFRNIDLPPASQVIQATLGLTPTATSPAPLSVRIRGQLVPDANQFANSPGNISDRTTTSSSVRWRRPWRTPSSVSPGTEYQSPDLSGIIDQILSPANGWRSGNNLALILTANGPGDQPVAAHAGNPLAAARLRLRVRTYLGGLPAPPPYTVRDRLVQTVDNLHAQGNTPIVDTLYEAALYFRGDPVDYGRERGSPIFGPAFQAFNRVSHQASYTGGTDVLPPHCSIANLSDPACAAEIITGSPVYKSPITQSCQANYIVLLTDGLANDNHSVDKIKSMTGVGSCQSRFNAIDPATGLASPQTVKPGEACGLDLVHYLYQKDQAPGVPGLNNITTYTIGFNLLSEPNGAAAQDWLKALAKAGNGRYFYTSSASELSSAFSSIVTSILSRTTSFASPSLTVNAFNKLFNSNEVYFSLFKPSDQVRWDGNVKKYQLCQSAADGCTPGAVLDASTPPKPAVGPDGRILDTAQSFWSSSPDGANILKGGAASQVPLYSQRHVFTYTGGPLPASLTAAPGDPNALSPANTHLTVGLLGGSTSTSSPDYMSPGERTTLIDWIRGQDVDDENGNGITAENRPSIFADPLHSSPVAVTYGKSAGGQPVTMLFVGTNDGALHMINAATGREQWAFFAPSTLANQRTLRADPAGNHLYGMDATPTVRIVDNNGDGIIDPSAGDKVYLYAGMRRGGDRIWAFDVTPGSIQTDPVNATITPTLLWHIDGGAAPFQRLGQTWSRPMVATVPWGTPDGSGGFTTGTRTVLLFGGGYDPAQDGSGVIQAPPAGSAYLGNAIYVVDPDTGQRLAYVTDPTDAAADGPGGVGVPGMVYSIPSSLALMDSNGAGAIDRLYVGDTGGQVWRVDLEPNLTSGGLQLVVGQLASVSTPGSHKNSRKFFYPPEVVQVRGSQYAAKTNYDLVAIASGNRAHPLDLNVQDRFYAFYDETLGALTDSTTPGIADNYPQVSRPGTTPGTLVTTGGTPLLGPTDADGSVPASAGDLFDATNNINFDPATAAGQLNISGLQSSAGYYIDFGAPVTPDTPPGTNTGEKSLSSPVVLAGKLFLTTYLPQGVVSTSTCAISEGAGHLYGINVLNGAPVFNWHTAPGAGSLTVADRIYDLGGGIPSRAVPVFQPQQVTLLIGTAGGAKPLSPQITHTRMRTYWYQQR